MTLKFVPNYLLPLSRIHLQENGPLNHKSLKKNNKLRSS